MCFGYGINRRHHDQALAQIDRHTPIWAYESGRPISFYAFVNLGF